MKYAKLILVTLTAFVGLTACNKGPKEANLIPKNASFVMALDPGSMKNKLAKGGISTDTLLNLFFKQDSIDTKTKAIFNQLIDSAGINWQNRLVYFLNQSNFPDKSASLAHNIIIGLSDASKWESFLKSQFDTKSKSINKAELYHYLNVDTGTTLSWNKDFLLITNYQHTLKAVYDTVAMKFIPPSQANLNEEVKKEIDLYFNLKTKESLANLPAFTDLFKKKADGFVFTSSNNSLGILTQLPIQLPKIEELLKDNYSTGTLSFEDGKIVMESNTYTNPMLSGILKKYAGPSVNLSMLENYPSENINSITLAAFNPEIFTNLLQQLEIEGVANSYLAKQGLSTKDLFGALKGDIAVIVSDLNIVGNEPQNKTDELNMMKKKSFAKMLATAPIGNHASFQKVMDKAVQTGLLKKQGLQYKAGDLLSNLGLYFMADDKNMIFASDSTLYAQYVAKAGKAVISKEAIEKFKGKSMVFYTDIAGTIKGLNLSNMEHTPVHTIQKTFKDLIATYNNFDGKSLSGKIEINLMDPKQNSLVTLTNLMGDFSYVFRKKIQKEDKLTILGIGNILRTY